MGPFLLVCCPLILSKYPDNRCSAQMVAHPAPAADALRHRCRGRPPLLPSRRSASGAAICIAIGCAASPRCASPRDASMHRSRLCDAHFLSESVQLADGDVPRRWCAPPLAAPPRAGRRKRTVRPPSSACPPAAAGARRALRRAGLRLWSLCFVPSPATPTPCSPAPAPETGRRSATGSMA